MHTDPDYSAAYVVLRTDADDGVEGHGLTFTSGRGTEVCVAAIRALEPLVVGRTLESISADMRGFWRSLASDTQLRWLGPGEGRHPPRHRGRRQRGLGPVGEARGQAALEAARRHDARGARRAASTSATSPMRSRPRRRSICSRDARRGAAARERRDRRLGVSGVHDLGGLARLRRRQGRVARPRGARGGLHAREDEGRRRPRGGRPPRAADPPGARPATAR